MDIVSYKHTLTTGQLTKFNSYITREKMSHTEVVILPDNKEAEINDRTRLFTEMHKWCVDNLKGRHVGWSINEWVFELADDAMLFKLTWV